MKKYINVLLVLLLCAMNIQIEAYKESFTNHTDKNIAIGMKYKGAKNLEFITMNPHEQQQFEPGSPAISGIKSGIDYHKSNAIPSTWYYLIDPPSLDDNNKNSLSWTPLRFTWLTSDAYKTILAITRALSKSTDKSPESITEIIKLEAQKASPEIVTQFTENDYSMENFIKKIGKDIGHSMAQDFHIDIIEDENSNLYFIAPL